jgi:Raf kinase inhibitor-like YbhB/YbcL family protein
MWTSWVKEGFMSKLTGIVVLVFFAGLWTSPLGAVSKAKTALRIYSQSFKPGEALPDQYTCEGENISPDVRWKGAPRKAQSFALIVEDPDAPGQIWIHWLIYNIPAKDQGSPEDLYELTEGYPRDEISNGGILQGNNDFNKIGYDGPCPPSGIHRYYFELYALDGLLDLRAGAVKSELETAMQGHILARAQMMGTYSK